MMSVQGVVTSLVGERLAPISLAELNSKAALQIRVDSKYILTLDHFDAFTAALRGKARVLSIEGSIAQRYDTTYFDSAQLGCYHDHLQRRRKTYKLRTRAYLSSGLDVFEVKMQDGRGHTVKRRTDHAGVPGDLIGPHATEFYQQTIRDFYGFSVQRHMQPSLRNQYSRLTLAAQGSPERTTVDFDLDMLDGEHRVGGMLSDRVLVETKSSRGSGETDRLLWRLGLRPVRVSKYCVGIALLHPQLPVNRYARTRKRYFDAVARPSREVTDSRTTPGVIAQDLPLETELAPKPFEAAKPPRPPRAPR